MDKKPSISERIENLENAVLTLNSFIKEQDKRMANVITSVTSQLKSAIEDVLLLVQAGFYVMSDKVGENLVPKIDSVVKDLKQEKLVKVFESNKARFMKEVEAGKFKQVDVVADNNPIVIGTCMNPDGSPYGAGVLLSSLNGLGKEMKEFFIGKDISAVFVAGDKTVVQLSEIYEGVVDETN